MYANTTPAARPATTPPAARPATAATLRYCHMVVGGEVISQPLASVRRTADGRVIAATPPRH